MVDLQAIVAFNAAAIMLLIIILVNARAFFHFDSTDNRLFLLMVFCTIAQAIIETISFFTVEVHFPGSYWFNVVISDLLFINNAMFSFLWVMYVDIKLFGDVQRLKKRYVIVGIPALIVILLSIVNLFCPVFFNVNRETLVYTRTDLYLIPTLSTAFYFLYGLVLSIRHKSQKNQYLFFPVLIFTIPIFIAFIVEFLFYGLNVLWIGAAISLTSVYINLQNQTSYIDPLSGVFTRQYMSSYIQMLIKRKQTSAKIVGIMLDINRFKHINDTYGHNVGDDAIRETGRILLDELHSNAKVFRFGGDEFLVIMLVKDETEVLAKIKRIHAKTDVFNDSRKNSYHLTFSIGFSVFDFDRDTYDSFLERMDKAMYMEKEKWKVASRKNLS